MGRHEEDPSVVAESITITDNRTGNQLEIPIRNGGVEASEWGKLLPGIWFYDPGFTATAACESSITFVDGDAGILRYRGYDIAELAENSNYLEVAYLLLHGELPTAAEFDAWRHEITYHTYIHENVRKRFLEGFHYDAHPMGMLVSAVAALSTFYLDAKEIFDPESRRRQVIRLIAKMPTLAAAAHRFSVGMPFVYPDNSLDFAANFLSMMWKVAEPRFDANPILARALDILFILHADHEQNCSTTAMRVVGSSHADPYSCCAAACAALYGPRHGGANEMVIRMLTEIGSIENVPAFIDSVKQGDGRSAPGIRPPRLQELRPPGPDHQADRRRGVRRHRQEPAARHRPQARGDRPLRRVLHVAAALPQRRLLLGPHLPGHGIPARDVPRALRHPPHRRVVGALAGDARPGLQDRPSPPALHRRRPAPVRPHRPSAEPRRSGRLARRGPGASGPPGPSRPTSVPSRVKRKPRARPRAAVGVGAVHVVEEPLVGPEGPVEPHAVVEAGPHELGVVPADLVGGEHGVEQRHVRGVGGDAGVQQRDRRAASRRPGSRGAGRGRRASCCIHGSSPTWRWSMGWGRANQSASSSRSGSRRSRSVGSVSGSGTSGMGTWWSKAPSS